MHTRRAVKTVTAVVMKLLELMDNGSGIMPLNSPGGSTLQCWTLPGLLCLALFLH